MKRFMKRRKKLSRRSLSISINIILVGYMAANRKLAQLVDSTLKKVDEGLEEFDEMWTKVEECTNSNQRVC
jgi:hypothetical protein